MTDKLKPCPFCGDNSHISVYDTGQYYHVHCNECAASGSWKTGREYGIDGLCENDLGWAKWHIAQKLKAVLEGK